MEKFRPLRNGSLKSLRRPLRGFPKALLWTVGGLAGFLLLLSVAAFFIDEPLRRHMEKGMNGALEGYQARIEAVDFHPVGGSVTVRNLVLVQTAHPEPPVAVFPRIDASVHWREIFTGNLVSDWRLYAPSLHINLQQLKEENEDEIPVEERGWREAIQRIYPLKINRLQITDGELTYIDDDPEKPLRLSGVNLTAGNIRNIRSAEGSYPSPFFLEADIFERGHGTVEGEADFLAAPHPGINARFRLQEVPLERLRPVGARANLQLAGGMLSGSGRIEYAPTVQTAHLADLTIDGLRLDYVHTAATAAAEEQRARKAKEAVKEAAKKESLTFQIDTLSLTGADLGYVNEAKEQDYRIFLSKTDLKLSNLSNRFSQGEAQARLEGLFMGSGAAMADAAFRPEKNGADFDLQVEIAGTPVTKLNDILRAHAGLDVVAGTFSLYSEVRVRGRRIDGYVKPFFKDLDIYDPQQEKGEGLLQKIKEGVAGAVGQVLENPREQVATQFDISGTVEDPEMSTWQIIVQLLRNGLIKAIIPGFEGEVGRGEGKGR